MDYKWQVFFDTDVQSIESMLDKKKLGWKETKQNTNRRMETSHISNPRVTVKNHIKRSLSQSSEIYNITGKTRWTKKGVLRKTKSLCDIRRSNVGFWNWQLETGVWSEVMIDYPLQIQKNRIINSSNQKNVESLKINFISPSSSNPSSGKILHKVVLPELLIRYIIN